MFASCVLSFCHQVKQSVLVDSAEASRKKSADATAAAAAAAEVRSSVGQSSHEAHAAARDGSAYNHTGADDSPKPHAGSGRPGPGGGGGGVSRVIGAAESAERDKFNSDKRNEVRLNTPHSGTSASETGVKGRSPAKGSPVQHRGKAAKALSPFEQAYTRKPCTTRSTTARCCFICPNRFSGSRIKVLPSRGSVANRQPWDIAYALQPQVSPRRASRFMH